MTGRTGRIADDTVERHLAALATGLHGPEKVRARLLREAHDGLTDAVADLVDQGVPADRAAERAVRDFGPADEVRPAFQRELGVAQARRTALLLAAGLPALIACWYLAGTAVPPALLLAFGGLAAATALLAAGAAVLTGPLGRRVPVPARLPDAVAWTATCTSVALAVGALSLTAVSVAAGDWAAAAVAGSLTLAVHARLGSSARACRHCAGLTTAS
ncbi:permease prefix domain 1-containing protein [Streptomyces sp. NPDC005805]|uniref:permease prefix domain 1-containing protein n=1 Tax=Streptomyces sp. NPDC005805 TaxID=3157068 RepID=UPI0033F942DC